MSEGQGACIRPEQRRPDLGLEKWTPCSACRGFLTGRGGEDRGHPTDLLSPPLTGLPEHSLVSSGPQDSAPLGRLVLSVLLANSYSFFKPWLKCPCFQEALSDSPG